MLKEIILIAAVASPGYAVIPGSGTVMRLPERVVVQQSDQAYRAWLKAGNTAPVYIPPPLPSPRPGFIDQKKGN